MTELRRAALFLSIALLTACLGTADDGDTPAPVDDDTGAPSTPGTPDDGTPPPNPALCSVDAVYPDLGPLPVGTALFLPVDANAPDGPHVVRLAVAIGQGPIVDLLFIDLWEGFAGFANGFAPGVFELVGPEADLASCGACVYMAGDFDTASQTVAQQFHANGGTLTIDSFNPVLGGQLTGTLSNVTLREVTADPMTNVLTDVPNGCTTTLQGIGFDLTLAAQ